EQRGAMQRAMTSTKFEDMTPADMGELHNMVATGQLDPKQLPAHLQSHMPDKVTLDREAALAKDLKLDQGYVDKVAAFKKVPEAEVIDFYQKGLEQGIDHQQLLEKARAKYPELTQADAELIYGYTTKLWYRDLNRALASGTATKEAKELAAHLVKALEKMPPAAETQYRGLRLDGDAALQAWDEKFALGKEVESDAFWSTGPTADDSYSAPRKLIIKTKKAKDITDLAFGVHMHDKVGKPMYSSEAIIPPGVKFKVIAVDAATGTVTIQDI
ncbi:MAG TPA: hypothetical protein VL172_16835, partial [Kofleriaceae bacterium]|nr:hypothetical protein [Kofleriaceae bacterium]